MAGIIRDYRISHWSNDDPQITNCLLCNAPNSSHPQYDYDLDNVQCPIIRIYTMDAFPETPPLRNRMDELVRRDIEEVVKQTGDFDD